MGKDPDAIRREIEATRAGMADTVDALAYKSDVKSRTKDKVMDFAAKPKGKFLSIKDNVMGTVQDHAPSEKLHGASDAVSRAPGQVADGAKRVGGVVKENPVGLAVGGLALGFITGLVLPNTRMEDEKLGPLADQLKDSVKESGQELLEHGKEVAQAAAGAAQDAAKDSGSDHAKEMAASAADKAQEVRGKVGSGSTI